MLIKKITYKDYNDVERTEDFYFNLSKAEVVKWITTNGNYTLDRVIGKLIESENVRDLVGEFEYLIKESYGVVSLDGKRFIKSQEVKDAFLESEAYSVLFMELVSDAKKAADFFNGILPADLANEIKKTMSENPGALPENLQQYMDKMKDDENKGEVVEMPISAATPTT